MSMISSYKLLRPTQCLAIIYIKIKCPAKHKAKDGPQLDSSSGNFELILVPVKYYFITTKTYITYLGKNLHPVSRELTHFELETPRNFIVKYSIRDYLEVSNKEDQQVVKKEEETRTSK
uniref:Uncharacterized protein n=1 Tax=Glossina pallidipes TaxID=7398 RepID=A0A1B0AFP4_GLOPL